MLLLNVYMLILYYFIYVDVDKMLVCPLHTNLFKACTLCLIVFFISFLFNILFKKTGRKYFG